MPCMESPTTLKQTTKVPRELRSGSNQVSRLSKMIAKLEKRVAELSVSQESLNQTAIRRRQRFEDRKGVLLSKRHLLDAQWIELVREKPAGIVSRAFFGGRAAAEIKRCMRVVESRRDDIDRELVAISAELNKPREKPKMSSAEQAKDAQGSRKDFSGLSISLEAH